MKPIQAMKTPLNELSTFLEQLLGRPLRYRIGRSHTYSIWHIGTTLFVDTINLIAASC